MERVTTGSDLSQGNAGVLSKNSTSVLFGEILVKLRVAGEQKRINESSLQNIVRLCSGCW